MRVKLGDEARRNVARGRQYVDRRFDVAVLVRKAVASYRGGAEG
ncbi:hypothetical protein OZ411_07320 [Bradyrhizobium sp. Arg237L]|nr:hypothetical protein [Bradyrhizobium sp. Arg237L]MDI4232622.1 hypothetical protein [Bradyrhizobium sp. Arg237L]